MRLALPLLAGLAALPAFALAHTAPVPAWSEPSPPHAIYGNAYQVGSKGLSSILITSPQGHILIDGTWTGNAPLIEANIRKLGFKVEDIKVILNSHAHFDHAGAIGALQKDSGAVVRATAAGAKAMKLGGRDPADPQFDSTTKDSYPTFPVTGDIVDGTVVTVGPLKLTAHITPGHTPGGTAWTWDSCEGSTCKHIAYVDSLYAFALGSYRYSDHPAYVAEYWKTFDRVASLPCDILVTPHPEQGEGTTCKAYAQDGREHLKQQLEDEKKTM
jgi:metallo-beta-lactamase class B